MNHKTMETKETVERINRGSWHDTILEKVEFNFDYVSVLLDYNSHGSQKMFLICENFIGISCS